MVVQCPPFFWGHLKWLHTGSHHEGLMFPGKICRESEKSGFGIPIPSWSYPCDPLIVSGTGESMGSSAPPFSRGPSSDTASVASRSGAKNG